MSSLPSRMSDALSGHYRLDQEIGAGGMATVYLAQDLRHDRRVAVKVLRPELAAVIGAERFLAEIKLTANLQHPHILPLFDSGEADSFLYYVMPFVEGESLRDRLRREKQLPVNEAIRIATEVATALDYAHRHGVVHRDIKPENILLHDGRALIADFGIALAASKAGGARMTETGMSLGTPHYMSPEQAMGEREITARSDVYALGCVLYEMLTGDPPFTGSTAQAVVARVVTETPRPLVPQRHTIPPHVEAAVLTALEKLPADRFESAAEFAQALARPMATRPLAISRNVPPATGSFGSATKLRHPVTVGLTALALGGTFGVAAMQLRAGRASHPPVVRFLFTGSDSAPVIDTGGPWPAAISPDGSVLVYQVAQPGGTSMLYFRRADQLEGHPIPGTLGGAQPLFSPDGRWIAFEAGDLEKKVRLDGSAPVVITRGGAGNGADWTINDELVLGATGKAHGLGRVRAAGGELVPVTVPDSSKGEIDHLWPISFPDGHTLVFTIWSGTLGTAELALTSLEGGPVTRLELKAIRPLAIVDRALVYLRADGAVMAVPLDLSHRRLAGVPVPVLDPVPVSSGFNGNAGVFVSRGGALVTGMSTSRSQLTWVSRDGSREPIGPMGRNFARPRISPDGRQIAVVATDGTRSDVWIFDLETRTFSRLTATGDVAYAQWSKDGKRVLYSAPVNGSMWGLWAQTVGNAADPQALLELRQPITDGDVSRDGHSMLLQSWVDNTWDVFSATIDSAPTIRPFQASRGADLAPRFSPDGRWAAVLSDESGTLEVYVRSFPEPTLKLQVSVGGGLTPVWSADGTSLYYETGTVIIQAKLATAPVLRVTSRDTVFKLPTNLSGPSDYDVSRDGSRVLISAPPSAAYPLVVVPDWRAELRERLVASRN